MIKRLGNLLTRNGGLPMTPRLVKITYAPLDPKTMTPVTFAPPASPQIEVALLPVGPARKARAIRAAQAYVENRQSFGDAPALADELVFQFLIAAMRDPEDLKEPFADAGEVDGVREWLMDEQQKILVNQYTELMRNEYGEIADADIEKMKQEAITIFPSGQGSP